MKFYGLDCHSDNIKMVLFDHTGQIILRKKIYLASLEFTKWLKTLSKSDYVALESSTNSFTLYDSISPFVKKCFVLNQQKMPEIWNNSKKTDYIDAEKLCERVWLAVSLNDFAPQRLPTVYIPEQSIRNLRGLFKSLEAIRQQIVINRNKIHAFFKQAGYCIRRSDINGKNFLGFMDNFDLEQVVKIQIRIFHEMIIQLKEKSEEIKILIYEEGKSFINEIDILTSIPGITAIGALGIMSDIGDISRFPDAKHFCSYLRTAPGIDSSNKTIHIKHINKNSRKLSLFYILQAQQHILRRNDSLNKFYIEKKAGKKSGTVRIAVARKTMVVIYHMLKKKEYYFFMNPEQHMKKVIAFQKIIHKAA